MFTLDFIIKSPDGAGMEFYTYGNMGLFSIFVKNFQKIKMFSSMPMRLRDSKLFFRTSIKISFMEIWHVFCMEFAQNNTIMNHDAKVSFGGDTVSIMP